MKLAFILIACLSAVVLAEGDSKDGRCPRQRECGRKPSFTREPQVDSGDNCRNLGPCECPRGYALIGSKLDAASTTQSWECRKYTKNCDIDCLITGQGYVGFCQSDTVIERELCRFPDCFFDEKGIYSSLNLFLNKGPDGFFVIDTNSGIRNSTCRLCKCGTPQCLKRIPYFEVSTPTTTTTGL